MCAVVHIEHHMDMLSRSKMWFLYEGFFKAAARCWAVDIDGVKLIKQNRLLSTIGISECHLTFDLFPFSSQTSHP